MNREDYIIKRIEMIEEELGELKRFVSSSKGDVISLRGVWEGADIPDSYIEEAKRSLFKGINIGDSHQL
jgi:hypothetical protein